MLLVNDRALLEAFRRGDRAALAEVYTHYADPVATLLLEGFSFVSGSKTCVFHGLRSRFDLEDRLHDVFSRAFRERARLGYDGLRPYRRYLFSIARNVVIDDFRRKERSMLDFTVEPANLETAPEAPEPSWGFEPDLGAEASELNALVRAFVGELPERDRTVYRARFEEQLDQATVAARAGLSASQVKTSEARIRKRFFTYLQAHGYLEDYRLQERGFITRLKGRGRAQ